MSLIRKIDPRHWRYIKRAIGYLRREYFTRNKGVDNAQVKVDATVEEMQELLGRRYFTNAWELSYHYEGEDLNMRRPEYVDDEYEWYQLHIRAFEQHDGLHLYAHFELEPTEHPYGHLEGTNFDNTKGKKLMLDLLDEAGVEYQKV